jgi:hypothetical protein
LLLKFLQEIEALSAAVVARNKEMEELRRDFHDAQRIQDNHVGEMGAALRRFIETVEKEMHSIEIWNRDNFVQKGEFERATDSIKADIKAMASDIKADIKDLKGRARRQGQLDAPHQAPRQPVPDLNRNGPLR